MKRSMLSISLRDHLGIEKFRNRTEVMPVMLAISCGSAEKEARRIIPLALTYLNKLPTRTKTDEDQLLKEQLYALCKQAQLRSPEFSADGFFTVNRTMVGFIIGSVTSYIIVTLQLAGDDSSKNHYVSHIVKT
ncbi:hypothetical protein WA026_013611 [Henosepilachna vigintioctopunctata]|uniref:Gustatory receptor n=1 Tax=Henosepilachna vigintioctopunctata TaxID=420089 RepID=A0AAW1V7M2_9CUCU